MPTHTDKGKGQAPPSPPPQSSSTARPMSPDPQPAPPVVGPSPTPELPPGIYAPVPLTMVPPRTPGYTHGTTLAETPGLADAPTSAPDPTPSTGGTKKRGPGRPKGSSKYGISTADRTEDEIMYGPHGPLKEPPKFVIGLPTEEADGGWGAYREEKANRHSKTPRTKGKPKSKSKTPKQDEANPELPKPPSASQPSQGGSSSSLYHQPLAGTEESTHYQSPPQLGFTTAEPINRYAPPILPTGTSPSHVPPQTSIPSSTPPSVAATASATPQPSTGGNTTGKRRGRPAKTEQSGKSPDVGKRFGPIIVNAGQDIYARIISISREIGSSVFVNHAVGEISRATILPRGSDNPVVYQDPSSYRIFLLIGGHNLAVEYSDGELIREGISITLFSRRQEMIAGEVVGPIIAASEVQLFITPYGDNENVEEKKRKKRKDSDMGDHEEQKKKKARKGPDNDPNSGAAGSTVPCY